MLLTLETSRFSSRMAPLRARANSRDALSEHRTFRISMTSRSRRSDCCSDCYGTSYRTLRPVGRLALRRCEFVQLGDKEGPVACHSRERVRIVPAIKSRRHPGMSAQARLGSSYRAIKDPNHGDTSAAFHPLLPHQHSSTLGRLQKRR
jgi:hypothetical protein